jgi:hypothetical protein
MKSTSETEINEFLREWFDDVMWWCIYNIVGEVYRDVIDMAYYLHNDIQNYF